MKKKINLSYYIIISLIFILLYVLLAAKPLSKEYQYKPQWQSSISNPVIKENAALHHNYFRLGKTLGYFTEDGNISYYKTFPAKASISDYYFAIYNTDAANTVFYNNSGEQAGVITESGFPYFSEENIYVFIPGGASFAKCYEDGKTNWKYEGAMPITAFNSNEEFTSVGFSDGSIKIFNNENGTIEQDFAPGGSDFPVILGLDISPDGEYIAAISGLRRQRFTISHKENSQQKIIFHTFLDKESAKRCLVHFCQDSSRVLYCPKDAIGIYDLPSKTNTLISIDSKILSIEENDNLVFLLGKKENLYTVYIIEKSNSLQGSFSFEANTAFLHADKENLYIGKDSSISKISITRE